MNAASPKAQTDSKLAEARREYARIRKLFAVGAHVDARDFDAAVAAKVGPGAAPERFVAAARRMRVECKRCAGTGKFITMVLNGQPTGPGGDCFRCNGKGVQNVHDAERNHNYDCYAPREIY